MRLALRLYKWLAASRLYSRAFCAADVFPTGCATGAGAGTGRGTATAGAGAGGGGGGTTGAGLGGLAQPATSAAIAAHVPVSRVARWVNKPCIIHLLLGRWSALVLNS